MANKVNRLVNLTRRTVKVKNLNYSPENAGEEKVARVDLSLEFLLEADDIDEIVSARTNPLNVLWDKQGRPSLRDLEWLPLEIECKGKLELNDGSDQVLTFDPAMLRRVKLHPMQRNQAEMRCQVRIDPGDHLNVLGDMRIHEEAVMLFTGADVTEPDTQEKLDV